jgi:hypothetical protein
MIDARTLRGAVEATPTDQLPRLLGLFAELTAIAQQRLLAPEPPPKAQGDNLELVDATEMARRLDVPVSWVRERARAGRIPARKLGHYLRFDPRAVADALSAQDTDS